MNFYKITLSYLGTNYHGWQAQTSTDQTIHGQLAIALKKICKEGNFSLLGSGRTDAGVHALAQVARLSLPLDLPPSNLIKALNSLLPKDIRLIDAEKVHSSFHPINDVKEKTYMYLFTNLPEKNIFLTETIANISSPLNMDKLKAGAKLFIGKHDFLHFHTTGSDAATTVREIYNIEFFQHVLKHEVSYIPEGYVYYELRFTGSGFLKQMIRLLVGTLWAYAQDKITETDIKKTLRLECTMENGKKLGMVAPPEGLFLHSVKY
jgi:tRNA pseudouridine38-40 synthase